MAGDNPIYALSSDIMSISVPPTKASLGGEYVNMFLTKQCSSTASDQTTTSEQARDEQVVTPNGSEQIAAREQPGAETRERSKESDTADSIVGNSYENIHLWKRVDMVMPPPSLGGVETVQIAPML